MRMERTTSWRAARPMTTLMMANWSEGDGRAVVAGYCSGDDVAVAVADDYANVDADGWNGADADGCDGNGAAVDGY